MTSWVWENSPYKANTLLIHMALADISNDAYNNQLWMSHNSIAKKVRVSRRTVLRTMEKMVDEGYAKVVKSEPGEPVIYQLLTPKGCDNLTQGGVTNSHRGCDNLTQGGVTNEKSVYICNGNLTEENPTLQQNKNLQREDKPQDVEIAKKPRPRDPIWDELQEIIPVTSPMSSSERGKCNKAVKELRTMGVDNSVWEIKNRALEYRLRYPKAALTWLALVNHWGELATPQREIDANDVAFARFEQNPYGDNRLQEIYNRNSLRGG